jgi:hypothetical protein
VRYLETVFKWRNCWLVAALCACLPIAVGCSTDSVADQVGAKNDSNIKRVVNLYYAFQSTNGWQGPKDEGALRSFAKSGYPTKNLQLMGIDPNDLGKILVSERDGKPFKIRYGITGGIGVVNPLVFEQDGVAGKRLVAFTGPVVEEVDEARHKELWDKGGLPLGVTSQSLGRPSEKTSGQPGDSQKSR